MDGDEHFLSDVFHIGFTDAEVSKCADDVPSVLIEDAAHARRGDHEWNLSRAAFQVRGRRRPELLPEPRFQPDFRVKAHWSWSKKLLRVPSAGGEVVPHQGDLGPKIAPKRDGGE